MLVQRGILARGSWVFGLGALFAATVAPEICAPPMLWPQLALGSAGVDAVKPVQSPRLPVPPDVLNGRMPPGAVESETDPP